MNTDDFLLEASIAAFESARDCGHELRECLRVVLNVAAPREHGPGMGIVSLVEPNPGEEGPEISLKDPNNEAWNLETIALTPDNRRRRVENLDEEEIALAIHRALIQGCDDGTYFEVQDDGLVIEGSHQPSDRRARAEEATSPSSAE